MVRTVEFPSTGAEQDAAEQDEGWWCTGRPLWPRLGLSPLSFAAAATRRRVSAAACAGSFARGVLAMLSLRDFLRRSAVLSLYRYARSGGLCARAWRAGCGACSGALMFPPPSPVTEGLPDRPCLLTRGLVPCACSASCPCRRRAPLVSHPVGRALRPSLASLFLAATHCGRQDECLTYVFVSGTSQLLCTLLLLGCRGLCGNASKAVVSRHRTSDQALRQAAWTPLATVFPPRVASVLWFRRLLGSLADLTRLHACPWLISCA